MSRVRVFLAPGASGGAASLAPYLTGLERRGINASAVELPTGRAERAVPAYLRQSGAGDDVVIGGRSFGGRVASLAAADPANRFAGLLLFAYPLHRPGFSEELRTEHWPRISCPVLIVQGEQDPFGSPEEVRREAAKLPEAEVVPIAGAGHTLKGRLDPALEAATAWLQRLPSTRLPSGP